MSSHPYVPHPRALPPRHPDIELALRDALSNLCKVADVKLDPRTLTDDLVIEEIMRVAMLPLAPCLRVRYVLRAKVKCLTLLGEYLKLFVKVSESRNEETITVRLEHALRRIADRDRAQIALGN